jgi:hypothetical protein
MRPETRPPRNEPDKIRAAAPRSSIEVVSADELFRFPATPYLYGIGERGEIRPS